MLPAVIRNFLVWARTDNPIRWIVGPSNLNLTTAATLRGEPLIVPRQSRLAGGRMEWRWWQSGGDADPFVRRLWMWVWMWMWIWIWNELTTKDADIDRYGFPCEAEWRIFKLLVTWRIRKLQCDSRQWVKRFQVQDIIDEGDEDGREVDKPEVSACASAP